MNNGNEVEIKLIHITIYPLSYYSTVVTSQIAAWVGWFFSYCFVFWSLNIWYRFYHWVYVRSVHRLLKLISFIVLHFFWAGSTSLPLASSPFCFHCIVEDNTTCPKSNENEMSGDWGLGRDDNCNLQEKKTDNTRGYIWRENVSRALAIYFLLSTLEEYDWKMFLFPFLIYVHCCIYNKKGIHQCNASSIEGIVLHCRSVKFFFLLLLGQW